MDQPSKTEETTPATHAVDPTEIKNVRLALGLSTTGFAALFGFPNRHAITRWESGKTNLDRGPTFVLLRALLLAVRNNQGCGAAAEMRSILNVDHGLFWAYVFREAYVPKPAPAKAIAGRL